MQPSYLQWQWIQGYKIKDNLKCSITGAYTMYNRMILIACFNNFVSQMGAMLGESDSEEDDDSSDEWDSDNEWKQFG